MLEVKSYIKFSMSTSSSGPTHLVSLEKSLCSLPAHPHLHWAAKGSSRLPFFMLEVVVKIECLIS